ncbi:MAG: PHP domain-containing protein [Clostridia bacterium]|nr:PHP domain-containing protein [Clostridia bacterium]
MSDFRVYASCHNHSTFSDGEWTPKTLARVAKCMGHGGIILTDHNTARGWPSMKAAAERYGLLTMVGCEFDTAELMPDGVLKSCHLLGFDFDPEYPEMKEFLAYTSSIATERCELLFKWGQERGTLRTGITWEDVLKDHPEHDYICNNEVFDSFVRRGIYLYSEYESEFMKPNFSYSLGLEGKIHEITGKSYTDISTKETIKLIKAAGGVPVLAHPSYTQMYTDEYVKMGVMGFETRHSMLSPEQHVFYEELCDRLGLYKMGGADHENVLGGLLTFDNDEYVSKYEMSGVDKENFMKIYERRLG